MGGLILLWLLWGINLFCAYIYPVQSLHSHLHSIAALIALVGALCLGELRAIRERR